MGMDLSAIERQAAVNALNDYEGIMQLNASAAELARFIDKRGLCKGVTYRGSSKADIARCYALREWGHKFADATLGTLVEHFGVKTR